MRLLLVVSTLADFFYQGRVRIPAENLTYPVWSELKEDLLRFIAARLRDEPAAPSQLLELSRSKRGFPISKGRSSLSAEGPHGGAAL